MFDYQVLQSFNDLETMIYHYVMQHKSQIPFMTVRELADAVHVSTASVMRFCKKLGCDGYSEFRVQFKLHLAEHKGAVPDEDILEIQNYFQHVHTATFEQTVTRIAALLRGAKRIFFVGVGTSGILGRYGARYFSNINKFALCIDDPFYPIRSDLFDQAVVVALSVSGETAETLDMVGRFREHNCKVVSITNKSSSTFARLSDENLSYFASEQIVDGQYNITTQIPVVFLLETLARRV